MLDTTTRPFDHHAEAQPWTTIRAEARQARADRICRNMRLLHGIEAILPWAVAATLMVFAAVFGPALWRIVIG